MPPAPTLAVQIKYATRPRNKGVWTNNAGAQSRRIVVQAGRFSFMLNIAKTMRDGTRKAESICRPQAIHSADKQSQGAILSYLSCSAKYTIRAPVLTAEQAMIAI